MRTKRRAAALLAGVLLAGLGMAACSSSDGGGGGADADGPLELLRWGGPGPVTTLDGAAAGDAMSMNAIYLTSGQLTRFNEDREPELDLAESIEVAEDGLSATVTFLPDLTYSDGTPIVAEDLRYAFERNQGGTGAGFIATIESIEVVDDRTAVVHLKGPDPDLLSWFAERALQLHPKSKIESDADYWSHPVSGGPYLVEEGWTPGSDVFRAVENPNYPHGPMMAETIELVSVPDASSRILQLTAGELDAAVDLPLSTLETLPEDARPAYAGVGGSNYLIANQTLGGPFADARVRQAMSLAIDRQAISDRAFFGLQPPSTSPMFDCGDLCERGLLPGGGARDLEQARTLLREAGYADGFEADLKVSSSRGGWQEAAVIIAENLAEIGIEVTVTPVDEGQHYSSITAQNYELFFSGGGAHHQTTISQMINEGDFWVAATGWSPPAEAADVLQRTSSTLDPQQRREAYTEAQRIWMDAMHVIPVVERVQLGASRVSEEVFVPQIKNDQKVIVQTVAQAREGA